MSGASPTHKIIRKLPTGRWETIGAGWEKDDGKMSVTIEPVRGGEKYRGLLVRNEQKTQDKGSFAAKSVPPEKEEIDDSIPF